MTRDIANANGVLVSVIVPVYNVEVYLRRCLDSIIYQTYTNLEIIVIDDGSTDRSSVICDRFAAEDPRIQVIHQSNQGLSAARNTGLDICRGDYICFVDSDDWIEPDMVEALYTVVINNSADIACCGRDCFEGIVPTKKENKGIFIIEGQQNIISALLYGINTAVWNKIYKRELFDDGLRFPEGHVYEDISIMWRIMLKCERTAFIQGDYYHYYRRKGSITRESTTENLIDYWNAHMERRESLISLNKEWERFATEDCMNACASVWRRIYSEMTRKEFSHERQALLDEVHGFITEHRKQIWDCRYGIDRKISMLFPLMNNKASLMACHLADNAYQRARILHSR